MFTLELTPGEINTTLTLIHFAATDYMIALYAGDSFITSSLKECVIHKSLNSVITNIALYDVELTLAAIAVMKRSFNRKDDRGDSITKNFTITINKKPVAYPVRSEFNLEGLDFITYNQYKDKPDFVDLMFSGTWNPKSRRDLHADSNNDWAMMSGS